MSVPASLSYADPEKLIYKERKSFHPQKAMFFRLHKILPGSVTGLSLR